VYDVLLPLAPANSNPILVPQPPPHLASLFPPTAHLDIRARPPSTYIGSVPFRLTLPAAPQEDAPASRPAERESSRPRSKPLLYALSSNSYPLINFAPPPRPGSLANGSFLLSEDVPEQDQLLPYLLDPPAEDMVPAVTGETGLIDPSPTPRPAKKWLKWTLAPLLCVLLSATGLAGYLRNRKAVKQSITPVDEKTPLLIAAEKDTPELPAKPEKSVTIIEPNSSAAPVKPGTPVADEDATPKKKGSNRRRVRGRKKKNGASKEGEGEDDDEDDDGTASPPASVVKKDDKPLPELPREISSTALSDMDDKERLAISDTIIGELGRKMCDVMLTPRLWIARNGGSEGYLGRTARCCQAFTERLYAACIARGEVAAG